MTDQEQGLKRELTARQMAMVAVGGSIGTGLLLGSGAAIQVAGPAVVLTFVLSALISWTVAMALGEMSAVHPAAGSFGVYAELYLNRWAGFIARYGYWFAVVIAIGSEVVAAGTYMSVWFPGVPVMVWMVVFALFLVAINLFSVGHYGTFEYWFAMIKVVTIFVFIVTGAALLFGGKVQPQYVANGGFAPRGWLFAVMATSFGLYSFLGIEMVAISSGEARSQQRCCAGHAHRLCHAGIYLCGRHGRAGGRDALEQRRSFRKPVRYRFAVAGIPAARFIMNLVVLTAALSAANASLYVTSRMLFSLARSGYAPQRLRRAQPAWRSHERAYDLHAGDRGCHRCAVLCSAKGLSLHHQCLPGRRHDRLAGLSAGACAIPQVAFSGTTGGVDHSFAAGRGRLGTGICRRGGCGGGNLMGIAVQRCRQERGNLSGGADGGVLGGEEEVVFL